MDSKLVYSLQLVVHRIKKSVNRELTTVNKNGLSLVELTIGFGIIAIIGVLIAAIYFTNFRLFGNQNVAIEVATQNKLALDEITNQIRESQQVATSCCNPTETTSDQTLVLGLWPLGAGGEPQDPTGGYDYIVYKRDPTNNTKLLKKVIPSAGSTRSQISKIISTNLSTETSGLNFAYDNANPSLASEVTVSITTTATNLGRTQTATNTSKAVLRNK